MGTIAKIRPEFDVLAGRAYYLDGTYAGRLVSIVDYSIDEFKTRWAHCIVRGLGGDFEAPIPIEDILFGEVD